MHIKTYIPLQLRIVLQISLVSSGNQRWCNIMGGIIVRIEEYTRELEGNGYLVVGSDCRTWNSEDSGNYESIKMSLGHLCGGGIDLEEMIRLTDSDLFHEKFPRERSRFFCENYAEIMRGNCPEWQLGAFRVFYGGIQLYYGNRKTDETGYLWITGAEALYLTFETPPMCSGFIPTYRVEIERFKGEVDGTYVEEDLALIS